MKRFLILFAALCMLSGCENKAAPPQARPVNVEAVEAVLKDAPVTASGVGHVVAMTTVAVQPQVTGRLASLAFEEGTLVREGQLLGMIDPAPFEAALNEAKGALNRDWAKAAQAGRDYVRYKELVRKEVVSQDEYEQYRTSFESGWQQVKADQGAMETARINLGYCRIVSPVTGVTGYQMVKPGNTVSAYNTTIATINKVQPVLVRFSVTEKDLALVRQYYGKSPISVSARYPKDEQDLKEQGELTAIDNTLDIQTGMISIQARFENTSQTLWPGQFVNCTATVAVQKAKVVIPFDAVMTRQDGSYVFVVNPESKAEMRKIETGLFVGRKEIVAESGLKAGERVITTGLVRVAPGGAVNVLSGSKTEGAGAAQ